MVICIQALAVAFRTSPKDDQLSPVSPYDPLTLLCRASLGNLLYINIIILLKPIRMKTRLFDR